MSKLSECVNILDYKRIPLSKQERNSLKKIYPYYGAQGIIDYVEDYIFDGEYVLVAEDGNNLRALNENIATWATGKFWVNNHAHIFGKKEGYNLKYIYYLINSMDLRRIITGSAQPKLSQENLASLEVNLPEKQTQDKIVKVLSAIDFKIDNCMNIKKKLENLSSYLFDYWLVQFDFPDENGHSYKSSGGKMKWSEKLKRNIPAGWEVKKLGTLFTTNRGVSYSTKTITGDKGIPMINLASFSPDGSYKIDGIKTYTGEYTNEKVLKPFDLVMCNTQQTAIDFSKDIIGKALLIPDIFEGDITSSHHVNTLNVHDEKLKFYLYRLFNTDYFHAYISHYASGTNIMGLDFAGVENYSAVIPSEEILSKFADFTLNIEKMKSEIIRENTKLISLRDRLLPLLMNGQVEVK